MIRSLWLLISLLVASASAQSTNLISVLISEGISLFTSITANLGSADATPTSTPTSFSTRTSNSAAASSASVRQSITSAASSAASSISTRLASESASISSQLSSALASISSQSSAALNPTNTITSNPSATSAAASADTGNGGSHRDRNLAIILGTVLGALALGLLILLLLILCRRRRRRAAGARSASLSSTSDEALTSQKTPLTSSTPAAAVLASRRSRSLNRRSKDVTPAMTQRSNYDVPSAHEFGGNNTAPFVPNSTGPTRTSGIVPTHNNGLTEKTPVHSGTGLNSHPYNDNFHPASMVAAGAGGAALGAAASRHSRSGERRSGERFHSRNHSGESLTKRHSRSGERHPDPVVSGAATHPAFWDEAPPPRSPYRNSADSSRRRSGSGPRGGFPASHEHAGPLRNDMSAVAAGGLAGAVAGTAANHAGHRGHERGRSLGGNNPIYGHGTNSVALDGQYAAPNYPVARSSNNPFSQHPAASNVPVTAMGGAPIHNDHSRSRSQTHPPIPPALVIPDPQTRRNLPSRSPKRARFAPGEHNEPMPYDDIRRSRDVVSPPIESNRNSAYAPLSAGTGRNQDPISPISPEDMTRGFNNVPVPVSAANTRGNPTDRHRNRSRSPDFTHTVSLPTTTTVTTMRSKPTHNPNTNMQSRPTRPDQQRTNSGLVDAVNSTSTPTPPPTYQAYSPGDELNRTTSRPMSRKPVAQSPYNAPVTGSGSGNGVAGPQIFPNRRSEDETWWRGQEDSAWRESYTGTPTGGFHAR